MTCTTVELDDRDIALWLDGILLALEGNPGMTALLDSILGDGQTTQLYHALRTINHEAALTGIYSYRINIISDEHGNPIAITFDTEDPDGSLAFSLMAGITGSGIHALATLTQEESVLYSDMYLTLNGGNALSLSADLYAEPDGASFRAAQTDGPVIGWTYTLGVSTEDAGLRITETQSTTMEGFSAGSTSEAVYGAGSFEQTLTESVNGIDYLTAGVVASRCSIPPVDKSLPRLPLSRIGELLPTIAINAAQQVLPMLTPVLLGQ